MHLTTIYPHVAFTKSIFILRASLQLTFALTAPWALSRCVSLYLRAAFIKSMSWDMAVCLSTTFIHITSVTCLSWVYPRTTFHTKHLHAAPKKDSIFYFRTAYTKIAMTMHLTTKSLYRYKASVIAFAVNSNAMVNSRQTCDAGDVKISCRKKHCHTS